MLKKLFNIPLGKLIYELKLFKVFLICKNLSMKNIMLLIHYATVQRACNFEISGRIRSNKLKVTKLSLCLNSQRKSLFFVKHICCCYCCCPISAKETEFFVHLPSRQTDPTTKTLSQILNSASNQFLFLILLPN